MGKNDFMTPKAIANRIKAKGLTKLRFYCQLCQKACRDENGFKCHQTSEGHRRQMEIFGANAGRVVDGYSEEFEREFMEHLRRAHPQSRVAAKDVYNEFIANRHHVHMNSTKWLTLSEFVKYLGREGLAKVEETPKGWYMTIIMEDPMKKLSDERRIKRTVREEEEEERLARQMAEQVERARKQARTNEGPSEGSALQRDENGDPIKLALAPSRAAGGDEAPSASGRGLPPLPKAKPVPLFGEDEDDGSASASHAHAKAKRSKMDELMEKEKAAARRSAAAAAAASAPADGAGGGRGAAWLAPGIVVKVMSKALKEHGYYKEKGVVERVLDKYVGEIAMQGSGDVVRVDQAELETVIPKPGGRVAVLNGPHRGCRGELVDINTQRFQALVRIKREGGERQEVWLEYEDISKLEG